MENPASPAGGGMPHNCNICGGPQPQLEYHIIRGHPLISSQEGVGTSCLPSGFYGVHGFQCTQNEEVCHRIHMDKMNVPCF